MTAPDPRPGDRVLIEATVGEIGSWPGTASLMEDTTVVTVSTRNGPIDLVINVAHVAEVLGPWWWPPQVGDHVIDADGIVWRCGQKDAGGLYWLAIDGSTVDGDELPRLVGPLELIARGGKPVDR